MFKRLKDRTDFLFSRTSFLVGAGSVFNLAGNYFSFGYATSGSEADTKALASDWNVVGLDLENALINYDAQLQRENAKQLSFDFDGRTN